VNSKQYEELCRFFLSAELGLSPDEIKSGHLSSATRPELEPYKNQIDLYWETEDAVARYLNIANAKWRGADKIDQPEVLLLQQVRQETGAHKALLITNTGFTSGATAAARQHRIGLHIVKPEFATSALPKDDRPEIVTAIGQIAGRGRPYAHQIIQKADGPSDAPGGPAGIPGVQLPGGIPGAITGTPGPFRTKIGSGLTRGRAAQGPKTGGGTKEGGGGFKK